MTATESLLQHLEASGRADLLLPEERELLESAEVRVLAPAEQWDHLRMNRRVGYWVTAVVGSLRILLLAGGAAAALLFSADRLTERLDGLLVVLVLLAAVGLAWTVRMAMALRRRLRELGRRLPPFSELGWPASGDPS